MNLQQTISELLKHSVTEEEAMAYARDNFGVLAALIRLEDRQEIASLKEVNKTLEGALNKAYEDIEDMITKYETLLCESHAQIYGNQLLLKASYEERLIEMKKDSETYEKAIAVIDSLNNTLNKR